MEHNSFPKILQCLRNNTQELHSFCATFPELKVSSQSEFMTIEELEFAILSNGSSSRYASDNGKVVGFCLGTIGDPDSGGYPTHACIVYLAVAPECRNIGIGTALLREVIDSLRTKGVSYIYTWACPTSGMVELCERVGMLPGRTCLWMDMLI